MSRRKILPALVLLLAGCAVLAGRVARAAEETRPPSVTESYIAACNKHDEGALRAVVADTARYVGPTGAPRLLIDQIREAWSHPATASSVYGLGRLDEKEVVIVWTRPRLADGRRGGWTKGACVVLEVNGGRITGATGVFLIDNPELQRKVAGEPPMRTSM